MKVVCELGSVNNFINNPFSLLLVQENEESRLRLAMFSSKHTLKAQVVVNQANGHIICTAFGKGQVHDFRLWKLHRIPMLPLQLCLADKGYQGIAKLHPNSCIPTKKPRKSKLESSERQHNRNLARLRVVAEHINRKLKIFRILGERYRNRRKRFGLRFNLIAAIINFKLALTS